MANIYRRTRENLKYTIKKWHDIEHAIGYPSANQSGNIYFTGACGGMVDDFMGFGVLRSIESGILAARAIMNNQDYDRLLQPFKKEVKVLAEYRKMINVISNKDYDTDMFLLNLPVLKQLLYNNPLYKAKHGLFVPKLAVILKKKNYPFKLDQR
ncbi:MAG: hypothetical protein FIA99_02495 [Ruminiclostridium sp.]|nr:hypothetical protein [Ruminiclostridium sp.]